MSKALYCLYLTHAQADAYLKHCEQKKIFKNIIQE